MHSYKRAHIECTHRITGEWVIVLSGWVQAHTCTTACSYGWALWEKVNYSGMRQPRVNIWKRDNAGKMAALFSQQPLVQNCGVPHCPPSYLPHSALWNNKAAWNLSCTHRDAWETASLGVKYKLPDRVKRKQNTFWGYWSCCRSTCNLRVLKSVQSRIERHIYLYLKNWFVSFNF